MARPWHVLGTSLARPWHVLGTSLARPWHVLGVSALIATLLLSCGKKPDSLGQEFQPTPKPTQKPAPDVRSAIVDDFLAHPVAITAAHWQNVLKPEVAIPTLLRKLAEGPKDIDRGHAVGNLADYATGLSSEKQAHRVTREILDKMVMPNLAFTKLIHVSSSHSWKKTILRCVTVYKRLNVPESEKNCILIFQEEAPLPEDREMATYMLAYWHAAQKDYPAAITTIQSQPPASKWADRKGILVAEWKKMQSREPKPSLPKLPTP